MLDIFLKKTLFNYVFLNKNLFSNEYKKILRTKFFISVESIDSALKDINELLTNNLDSYNFKFKIFMNEPPLVKHPPHTRKILLYCSKLSELPETQTTLQSKLSQRIANTPCWLLVEQVHKKLK